MKSSIVVLNSAIYPLLTCELNQVILVHMSREHIKQISVRFPEDLYNRIDEEAKEGDRSFNAQVIRNLKEYYRFIDAQKQGKKGEGK